MMRAWVLFFVLCMTLPALAQSSITADDVNKVAERMYCPVCENIPLDDCGTSTCIEWKNDIAIMLRDGQTSDQILASFVQRYGEKVAGVPQDPTLRVLSWIVPLAGAVLALIVGVLTFQRWGKRHDNAMIAAPLIADDDPYRALLERDVQ